MRRATADSPAWQILSDLDPDIMLLQEVGAVPEEVLKAFSVVANHPRTKNGKPQKFQSVVLSRFPLEASPTLGSELDWVNEEREHYSGNILGCAATTEADLSQVKLANNPKVYVTEILWKLLRDSMPSIEGSWIIAGDFNSSTTFDWMWGGKPRGNQEIIDRMNALGLFDCLSSYAGELVPTFMNARGARVIHQLDYVYTDSHLSERLRFSRVVSDSDVFERALSDHLPVVSDFTD